MNGREPKGKPDASMPLPRSLLVRNVRAPLRAKTFSPGGPTVSVLLLTLMSACASLTSACATPSTTNPAGVEPQATDPWALRVSGEVEQHCPRGERRCRRGVVVPECKSRPAPSEVTRIGRELSDKLGQRVTVIAKPSALGFVCTLEGCACCNVCSGPLGLCDDGGRCNHSVAIGSCGGDQRLICCDMTLEDRPLVAKGVLRVVAEGDAVFYGSDEPEAETGAAKEPTRFELDQAEYCYLRD
jgi:hypothetical protein